jgi:signal transduction histidine kinase
MRLLPQSLFGRLLMFLLTGLILAQLLSAGILLYDRKQVLQRALGGLEAKRIAAIVALLEELPTGERSRLAAALDLPPTRISLSMPWQAQDTEYPQHTALLIALLRRQLPAHLPVQASVFDVRKPGPHNPQGSQPFRHHRGMRSTGIKTFQVQVGLSDGTIATFRHDMPEEVFALPYRLLLILSVLLLSVVVLAILTVRWLTRPLDVLATAATALGRDIRSPPLEETGPLEVKRAARSFNTMQARLARYIQDRSRILAAVSHDLKTPITRLRLRAELLDDPQLQRKFQSDLDEMEAMVHATLEFMRGTEQSEKVVPVDIGALLESLQEDALETNGEVRIAGTPRTPFQGRPLALKRCLNNLIDNALHYGKRAEIRVIDHPDLLTLIISDEGPGIAEAELKRVFDPFYRLEGSRSRNTGGTGLGLGIARNIARAHGGELTLRNGPHGGLEATLRLPR